MINNTKITIVTVVLNAANTIEDTICSVLTQKYLPYEYLIIDGGSIDGTHKILEKYSSNSLIKIIRGKDKGLYDAMNKGIDLARGEVIAFLNADDTYINDRVLLRINNMFKTKNIDACYSDLIYVNKKNVHKVVRYWKSSFYRPKMFHFGWMPPHPTFFCKLSLYHRFGYFNLKYKRHGDFELMLRFFEVHKINARYLPYILVRMRLGGISNRSFFASLFANVESYRAFRENKLTVSFSIFMIFKAYARLLQYFTKPKSSVR